MSLSNYEVQKVLGKGSFGTVIKVKDKKDGFIYAMKRINLNINDEEIQASLNEIRLLYSLNHPNIISYKEAFYDKPSNSLNIVIEYAGDGDLLQKINMNKKYHKRIDENTIWDWVIQLIIGIYYLHISNCIHRDLKSANIFLKKNGRIKIGDLGVSKFLKKDFAETFTGTPLYIAPEMLNDLPYDYKVDIWSLGCIVYELCALETPFNGRNMNELFKNIKAGRYIPIPNKYSNDLKKIIALMLQTNPNKRISSIELLYLPIIKSKMNKNYSKYQELIEKVKKPEIIQTILLQQKKLPKKEVIPKRSKSRDISKSRSKSKSKSRIKKPPVSVRKKKFINKNKDLNLKNRSSSARNNLRNYNPYYNKNRNQKYYNEHSERDYDNKSAFHNNYINKPSYYSKYTQQNYNDEYNTRDYDNKRQQNYKYIQKPSYYSNYTQQNYNDEFNTRDYDNKIHQNYKFNQQPSYYSKYTQQNHNDEYNTRDNDNKSQQNYKYNELPPFYSKNNIKRNYTNNNDMDYNEKKNNQNKIPNLIKIENNYDYDEFRPINNVNIYNNNNNYNQIEFKKNNYNMKPISKYDY